MSSTIYFFIRPEDFNGWILGNDWKVEVKIEKTLPDLFESIHTRRPHILANRINAFFKSKRIPEARYNWNLSRLGIANESILTVRPTIRNGWLWNPISYYHDQYLREVANVIIASQDGRVLVEDIEAVAPKPPVIERSLKVFLRTYPERIFLRTDINTSKTWAQIAPSNILYTLCDSILLEYNIFSFLCRNYCIYKHPIVLLYTAKLNNMLCF